MKNRTIESIMPEALLETVEFQNGVVAGFHMAAKHLAKHEPIIILTESTDWAKGFNAGIGVRLLREAETPGGGVARSWLKYLKERNFFMKEKKDE